MKYEVIFSQDAYTDEFGEHQAYSKHQTIPFEYQQIVWYCYKRFRKWAVRKSRIDSMWATNVVGVRLDNQWAINDCEFDRLFTDKNEAIDFCLKQNQRGTVKIYNANN